LDTKEIIKHCINGNTIAQGVLFSKYYTGMYHLSMRILANHHDVEDILITAFTRVFRFIHKFEYQGEGSLEKWIKTIIIRESIRFLKYKKRIVFYDDVHEYEVMEPDSAGEFSSVDIELIYNILETMPDGYRMVFNLFAIEGYPHKEIATLLDISENTSKSQLRKARIFIAERIQKIQKYG
jgi:RNA polymerase sigma-70 factor, ECF subfamily